ncbi:MAG TPA: delta-60 repeat domain-containing protein [Verrucomicrobiae bacterium]|nr:delta-60 repeat domain-containing protein [Verrucomicrobiae bacterium]
MSLFKEPFCLFIVVLCLYPTDARPQTVDSFNASANAVVDTVATQPNGRVLVGGQFSSLDGESHVAFGSVLADGSLDHVFGSAFQPVSNFSPEEVVCTAIQSSGKVWLGGNFNALSRECLLRLNSDGSLDTNFDAGFLGANVWVDCLHSQPDGKLLVSGSFTMLLGQPVANLGRINEDSSLDSAFKAAPNGQVSAIALQPDGKIVVAGAFTSIGGGACNYIGRLNPDGTLDTNFNATAQRGLVSCLLVQPDGKILAGGLFTSLGGHPRTKLGRLNSDGSLDLSFNPQPDNHNSWGIRSLLLQTDSKILVGGDFVTMAGTNRPSIARLNSDGTLDPTFDAQVATSSPLGAEMVVSLAAQNDQHILVGGSFTFLDGAAHNNVGRLTNVDPSTQSLTNDTSSVTWLRGGSSIEVEYVTFEGSMDGTNWTFLGQGERIAGGWHLGGLSVAPNATVRARGFLSGGQWNGSTYYFETITGIQTTNPLVLVNDSGFGVRSNKFGFTISAQPGRVLIIESSTDLSNWQPVSTNTLQTPSIYFSQPYDPATAPRFFRAAVQ